MHGVDLGQVTPEGASRPHLNAPDWVQTGSYLSRARSDAGELTEQERKVPGRRAVTYLMRPLKKKPSRSGSINSPTSPVTDLCQGGISARLPGILVDGVFQSVGLVFFLFVSRIPRDESTKKAGLTLIWFRSCSAS